MECIRLAVSVYMAEEVGGVIAVERDGEPGGHQLPHAVPPCEVPLRHLGWIILVFML